MEDYWHHLAKEKETQNQEHFPRKQRKLETAAGKATLQTQSMWRPSNVSRQWVRSFVRRSTAIGREGGGDDAALTPDPCSCLLRMFIGVTMWGTQICISESNSKQLSRSREQRSLSSVIWLMGIPHLLPSPPQLILSRPLFYLLYRITFSLVCWEGVVL